jgi:tetratricopeptide (TPR) repeat protein
MTFAHRILLALLVGAVGVGGYLWVKPYAFTSAKTLYERGLVAKEAGMGTDALNQAAIEEAARYFELALDKGYRSRDVFQNLYWCYAYSHNAPAVEATLSRGLTRYPTDQEFWCRRADARLERKNFGLALADFNNGLRLPAKYKYLSEAFYGRGAAKYMLSQKQEAEKDRTRAQMLSGDSLRTYEDYCKLFN